MPKNPYDDILAGDGEELSNRSAPSSKPPGDEEPQPLFTDPDPLNDPRFQNDGPEALDLLLAKLDSFEAEAGSFSRLLSELRVVDHKVEPPVKKLFLQVDDPHVRGTLDGEKQYHLLQEKKFRMIIEPMRDLALMHQDIVIRFDRDVDEHYFSVERTEREIEADKTRVMEGIILQRKILGEAAESLKILTNGLRDTERRIKEYVNAGGRNNISESEYSLIVRNREHLTNGFEHQFDHSFFGVNLLDKTAISLGVFVKETSKQYLKNLGKVFSL